MDARTFFTRPEFVSSPERASHGILAEVPGGPEGIEVIARNVAKLSAAHPDLTATRLWHEALPVPASDELAELRRDRELRRAVPAAAVLRAVVLEYADARADLILTAHRGRLDGLALNEAAALLLGERASAAGLSVAQVNVGSHEDHKPHGTRGLGFGLSADRPAAPWVLPLPELAAAVLKPAEFTVAIAAVLTRYGESGAVTVAIVESNQPDSTRDEFRLLRLECTDSMPVGDALRAVAAESAVSPIAEPPGVGIVVTHGGRWRHRPLCAPPFPITVCHELLPNGGGRATCVFDSSAVSIEIAADFARYLGRAISQIREGAHASALADLELMTADDIVEVLSAGDPQCEPRPDERTIPSLFAEVTMRQPTAPACSDSSIRYSYGELDERSGAMAASLRDRGILAGCTVGVCLDRGAELIAVLLAVLRAGATYVPMDVRAPAARLAFTARAANLAMVITDAGFFPDLPGIPAIPPHELFAAAASPPETSSTPDFTPDDIAYVIYTSGTSGRPKGVMVSHRKVLALISAANTEMNLNSDDVWTQYHESSFDFSVWEIWGCLLTGGHLVCVPYWVSRMPGEFRALLVRERVTVLSQTPSALAQLLAADAHAGTDLAVRLVICGGETLHAAMLRGWFDRHPYSQCRVVNMYGITETTVHVTRQLVSPTAATSGSRSVGRPLPGWSVSVRDSRGRPLPLGARGEIYVGGVGVAIGYLRHPELTAERFVEDPYGQGRIYRSGDLGRLHPDGTLDHLGRVDNQVQLRGYRIELDEIRSVLLEKPEIHMAEVIFTQPDLSDPASARLDAYVVLHGDVSVAQIRRWAARMLPDYMVPSSVTVLDELPRTANGKIARGQLPAPRAGSGQPVEGERTHAGTLSVLDRVARAWQSVFGTAVGPDDDFFELGGNSLLAVRLLNEHLAAGLPALSIEELYERTTVAGLAEYVEMRNRRAAV
jgi:amino acid adenylation domain-containing protein